MSERPPGLWAWLCNRCGQELLGPNDTCNSGYHVGPDGGNVGKAILSGALAADRDALAADLETTRQALLEAVEALRKGQAFERAYQESKGATPTVPQWERLDSLQSAFLDAYLTVLSAAVVSDGRTGEGDG